MSQGSTHDASILLTAPIAAVYFHSISPTYTLIATTTYLIGGWILSPDVDLKQSKPSQRWLFLSPLWYPYREASGHRDRSFLKTIKKGSFSHFPIIGTLSRMGYLSIFILAIAALNHQLPQAWGFIRDWFWLLFIPLELSALNHLICDFTPGLKDL